MECLECKKEVTQTPGKRKRLFCNSTCRSNYWQKETRKSRNKIKDLTNSKKEVKQPESPKNNAPVGMAKKPFMSDAIKKKLGIQ